MLPLCCSANLFARSMRHSGAICLTVDWQSNVVFSCLLACVLIDYSRLWEGDPQATTSTLTREALSALLKWKDLSHEQIQLGFCSCIQAHVNVSSGLRTIFQSLQRSSLCFCCYEYSRRPGLSLSPFFSLSFSHRPGDGHGMTAALNPPH